MKLSPKSAVVVVALSILVRQAFPLRNPRGQDVPAGQSGIQDRKRSFLEEKGSPFEVLQQGGSVLVLRNIGDKDIKNWGEMCLTANRGGYKVMSVFTLDHASPLKPGETGVDMWGIDATPLVLCRAVGGMLAISTVEFADGPTWKSRWLQTKRPKVAPR